MVERPSRQRQMDQSILLRLPADLHDQLRQLAKDQDRSMAGILRVAVRKFIEEERAR
jgi:predicted DNA-binding protein